MIDFTDDARKHLDKYLQQMRSCLQSCKTVDADEIEQNITEHIETELKDIPEPISLGDLDPVLKKLGSPEQWVPEEEITWWRKVILRFRTGPEDWRLAYISFSLFVLAFLLFGRIGFFVLLLASFCISRAAVSVSSEPGELREKKWLIYPSLVLVYVPVILFLFLWLFPIIVEGGDGLLYDFYRKQLGENYWKQYDVHIFLVLLGLAGMALGLWWIILGVVLTVWHRIFRTLFHPFADSFKRKWAIIIIGFGIVLILLSGAWSVILNRNIPTKITDIINQSCPLNTEPSQQHLQMVY